MVENVKTIGIILATLLALYVYVVLTERYANRKRRQKLQKAWEDKFNSFSDSDIVGYVNTFASCFVGTDKKIIPEFVKLHWQNELDNCFLPRYLPWQFEFPKSGLRVFGGHALMDKTYGFEVGYVSDDHIILNSPELGDIVVPWRDVVSENLRKKLQESPVGTKLNLPGGILFDE